MNHPYFPYMWLLELVEILSQRALPVDSSTHIQVSKYDYWLLIKFSKYTHSKHNAPQHIKLSHHSPDSYFLVEWDGIPIMLQWNFTSCCCWLIYDNVCSYISNLTIQCLQKMSHKDAPSVWVQLFKWPTILKHFSCKAGCKKYWTYSNYVMTDNWFIVE